MVGKRNPYRLDPVDNPRLLRARRFEIAMIMMAVAPEEGPTRHALIVGDQRMGRTSVLQEVARRASTDRGVLVIWLRLLEQDLTTSGLQRALLNATIETLAADENPPPDWYLAWCDRAHLHDRSAATVRDRLISGLVFATDNAASVDRALLARDLRFLSRLAAEHGKSRIMLCVDDADALLEDVALVEQLLDWVAAGGDWSIALTTTPHGSGHLAEAVSPALRQFVPVWLPPFWTLDNIRVCLTAPLEPDDVKLLMPASSITLLFDLLRLTGGNPFEIAVIAQHLWTACRLGEQERYELTPRVLERALSDIARLTGAEAELVAGARAVQQLEPDHIGSALDLLALSELTIRQVAIARLLGVPNPENTISNRVLTADIDEEEARVVEELEELECRGVVSFDGNGGFTVQGGHAAIVALKYQAQSLLGPDRVDKPFGIPFLPCVGQPLAEDYARRGAAAMPGVRRLASSPAFDVSGSPSSSQLRAALRARPFAGLDLDVLLLDDETEERMVELVLKPGTASIVVVDFTLVSGDHQLDWIEIWEVPVDAELHSVNQCLSDALDGWQELALAAGVHWRGSHAVMFHSNDAARALIQLCPYLSEATVYQAWEAWTDAHDGTTPDRVLAAAETVVQALADHRVPDWEHGFELSSSLSRLGFLLSFYDSRLDEARIALETAKDRGPADGWVTEWNLANLAARSNRLADALTRLDRIAEEVRSARTAHLLFFVPGRDPVSSLVHLDEVSAAAVFALQRTVIAYLLDEAPVDELGAMVESCAAAGDVGAEVATWVRQGLLAALPGTDQP